MGKFTDIFTKDFPECLYAFRRGPVMVAVVYVTGFVLANGFLAYVLYTGNMFTRLTLDPVDGRNATPILYWLYVIGIGTPIIALDCWVAWGLVKSTQKHD